MRNVPEHIRPRLLAGAIATELERFDAALELGRLVEAQSCLSMLACLPAFIPDRQAVQLRALVKAQRERKKPPY